MALEITDSNFQALVLDSDKLSVIDFRAEWCGPCRAIGPIIEDLSKQYAGKVNVARSIMTKTLKQVLNTALFQSRLFCLLKVVM